MTELLAWANHTLSAGPRDVVVVTGGDAERYLQSQLAHDVTAMAVGEPRWSLLLEPDGRVVALVRVVRSSDGYSIDADPGAADVVAARLRRFLLRVDVAIDVEVHAAGADPAIEAERIARGWPAHGAEIIPGETLPAEVGVTDFAVSFTKGCYPGQELVERMDSRGGSAPFRIVILDDELVAGTEVVVGGEVVGRVTSAAGGRSLARIKRAVEHGRPAPLLN